MSNTWIIIAILGILALMIFRRPTMAVTNAANQVNYSAAQIGAAAAGAAWLGGIGTMIGGIIHSPQVSGSATSTAGIGASPPVSDDMADLTMH